jgi:amino acid transporter
MIRFITLTLITIGLIFLFYNLLSNKEEKKKEKKEKKNNWLKSFNKPLFKITIGSMIILIILISTLRLVKVLPIVMKLGIIAIDFVIIYAVITYLFNIKNKN